MNIFGKTALLGVCATFSMIALPSVLQAQAAAGSAPYSAPRTEYGHPDLQGNWSNSTLTPIERPAGQAPTMPAAEAARIEGSREERFEAALAPSDPNRDAPPVGGDGSTGAAGGVGGYNSIYVDPGDRIAVVNGEYRTSLITNPPDGQIPPVTEATRAAMAAARQARAAFGEYDNPENRPLGERCIISFGSNAGPPMLPNGFYNNNYTIAQNADHVMIMSEMVHDLRIIRLGEPQELPDGIRPWFGESWGRWEGDTLVVETTRIHPLQQFERVPSDNMKVVERFHRADENTIVYRFTVEDPAYTRSWGGEVPLFQMTDLLYEYACHEGNYALSNILSGARAQEAEAATQPPR